jgi:hypothetical protein
VLLYVLEELDGAFQLPAIDSLGGLTRVLEGNTEIGTSGAGTLCWVDLGGGVSNLCRESLSASWRKSIYRLRRFVQIFAKSPEAPENSRQPFEAQCSGIYDVRSR